MSAAHLCPGEGDALEPGASTQESKHTVPAGLSPCDAVNHLAALCPLFPTGGGTHSEVIDDFPSETVLFY